ncbi:MAG: transporter [Armatimonadetes bacterium]|nr:transporter [Armatimonadota bacterium]
MTRIEKRVARRPGRWAPCLLLLATTGPAAAGQGTEPPARPDVPPTIVTDRPDFTESSLAIPRGMLQIESGFTYTANSDGTRLFNIPETLFRWGIGGKTEIRLAPADFLIGRNGKTRRGFGDTYLGFKRELGSLGGFDLALMPAVTLPTSSRGFGSGSIDPEIVLTWARDLKSAWSVGGILGMAWPREPGNRNTTFFPTISFSRSLGGRLGWFFEYAGTFSESGDDVHLLHHGYTYLLNNNSQLDLHGGFGISRAAPDFFIGAGYSVRF